MTRHAADPKVVEFALAQVRAGVSQADIAEVIGMSEATVQRWCKKAGVVPCTVMPAALETHLEGDAEPSEPLTVGSDLENLRAMQLELREQARTAKDMGNMTAAQRAMRDAANLAPVIARLEKAQHEGGDVVHIPVSEIAGRMLEIDALVARHLDREMLCAECGRKLSAAQAEGKD